VVQGYSPQLDWHQLAEGAVAIQAGARWIATNLDATVPSARGPLPGNGSMIAALRHATGAEPFSTGKPDPTMHAVTVQRSGAQHPLVVGDRLDTDIEGANRVGCASLLVLSGVTTPRILLAAPDGQRPDFIADDVSGLLQSHPETIVDGVGTRCGRWHVESDGDALTLSSAEARVEERAERADQLDALRALAELSWSSGIRSVRSRGDDAAAAVTALDLN
jgi:glycerol 3-phosphatase-2